MNAVRRQSPKVVPEGKWPFAGMGAWAAHIAVSESTSGGRGATALPDVSEFGDLFEGLHEFTKPLQGAALGLVDGMARHLE